MTSRGPAPSVASVVLALLVVYLVWGSTFLAIAYVVDTLPPFLAASARFLLSGAILLGFLLAQDRWRRRRGAAALTRPRLVEWRTALIVGVLLILGGNGMVMVAEQVIPSGIAAVLIATEPIWIAFFDALITRRRPSLLAMGGVLVGLAGVAVLLLPGDEGGSAALAPWGIGLLVLANIGWAAGSIYTRHGPLPRNGMLATGMEQLAGGGALLVAAFAAGEVWRVDLASVSVQSWVALGYLVVFGSLLAFTAYTWLLRHVPVTTVATYAYVNPIVAVALGVLFRGEELTPRTLLAAALIIGAVVAMVSGRPREAGKHEPTSDGASPQAA